MNVLKLRDSRRKPVPTSLPQETALERAVRVATDEALRYRDENIRAKETLRGLQNQVNTLQNTLASLEALRDADGCSGMSMTAYIEHLQDQSARGQALVVGTLTPLPFLQAYGLLWLIVEGLNAPPRYRAQNMGGRWIVRGTRGGLLYGPDICPQEPLQAQGLALLANLGLTDITVASKIFDLLLSQ